MSHTWLGLNPNFPSVFAEAWKESSENADRGEKERADAAHETDAGVVGQLSLEV